MQLNLNYVLSQLSPVRNPQWSVTRVLLFKIRMLLECTYREFSTINFRKKSLSYLKKIKNTKSHKFALVIANGPSFSEEIRKLLKSSLKKNLEIFSVNYFPLLETELAELVDYLVLSDPKMHPNFDDFKNQDLWKFIQSNEKLRVFVPHEWYPALRIHDWAMNRFYFFDDTSLLGVTNNVNPTKPRGYSSLTAYKAIAIASFLGFKQIGIIGVDNSQFLKVAVSEFNKIYQSPHYFVNSSDIYEITDQFPNGIGDYFYDFSQIFLDLRKFKNGAIVNLDPKSLVDSFKKVEAREFFEAVSK